jgi:nicotinate-nucleotide pyrophosphorylase (carboxylating)
MTTASALATPQTRAQRIEQALYRGNSLTMSNLKYREMVRSFLDLLLTSDIAPRDLTVAALGLPAMRVSADIIAREPGIAAGLDEFAFLFRSSHATALLLVNDGDSFNAGEVLARVEAEESMLLSLERTGLNLLQRMCGIATAAHALQSCVARRNPECRVVSTRKTPCGLLDKRAACLGGVGSHRIGLGDAILIKNNHLASLDPSEEKAAPIAVERVWELRNLSAFIEVEVRTAAAAIAAAAKFRDLLAQSRLAYPCLIMLDNMSPGEIAAVIRELRAKNLYDAALIEASGGITEANIEAYADSGADAISVGALTHSPRALDIAQRIS